MMQKVPTTHGICSPTVRVGGRGEEEEEEDDDDDDDDDDEQKQDKGPNTCQLKNLRPEPRKYWPIHITALPKPTSHDQKDQHRRTDVCNLEQRYLALFVSNDHTNLSAVTSKQLLKFREARSISAVYKLCVSSG